MIKLFAAVIVSAFLVLPVSAAEITAPEVPASGAELMPEDTGNFWKGFIEMLAEGLRLMRPDLKEASGICGAVIAIVILISMVHCFPGSSRRVSDMVGTVAIGSVLLESTNSLVALAGETITELTNYGKLFIPVMTTAMAAQGGVTSSAALYTGTAVFNALLSSLISRVLLPMVYIYLAFCAANAAIGEDTLKKLRDHCKGLITWVLKTLLYVFTGYMGITGVVSGTTDAATLKATKLTISGMVPVVGGILSDASEAVLVSTGVVKNAAGIYGILAVLAVCLGPFLRIGVHYLLLKATCAVCGIFDRQSMSGLIQDFSGAMGLLLAMTGTVCLLLLISTVCFLREVG